MPPLSPNGVAFLCPDPRFGLLKRRLVRICLTAPAWFLDIALEYAAHYAAAPANLIRAARDLKFKEPGFAKQVALQAIHHLVEWLGYWPSPQHIDKAVEHLMVAAARLDEVDQARQALQRIASSALSAGLMADKLARNIAALQAADREN